MGFGKRRRVSTGGYGRAGMSPEVRRNCTGMKSTKKTTDADTDIRQEKTKHYYCQRRWETGHFGRVKASFGLNILVLV